MSRFCCCVDATGTAYIGQNPEDYIFVFNIKVKNWTKTKMWEFSAKATYLQSKLRGLHIGPEQMIFSNEAAKQAFFDALDVEAKQNTYDS